MAELATIARPYAEALFRVAKTGDLTAWATLVGEMAQVAANKDFEALARNPKIADAVVHSTFLSALKSPVGA